MFAYSPSEARQQTMTFDASSSIILSEFQALVVQEDEEIKIRMKLGGNNGSGDRLEAGDIIIMMNGKRVKDLATFREMYDAIPVDEEINIGVRRGEERFILRKKKGDVPEGGAVTGTFTRTGNAQNTPSNSSIIMSSNNSFTSSSENVTVIAELGLILGDSDRKVRVMSLIDFVLPDEYKELSLQGSEIKSINGTTPKDSKHAKEMIDEIETTDDLSIVFVKEATGDEIDIMIQKPESKGNMVIKSGNQ